MSPRSRPICANVVLHDTRNDCASVPPHCAAAEVRQRRGRSAGGRAPRSSGYTGLSTVSRYGGPGGSGEFGFSSLSRPMPVVTTLNVEPGGKISRHARASAGLVGSAFERGEVRARGLGVVARERVRIERRVRVRGDDAARRHVEHDDRAAPPASASAAACCAFCVHREHDVAALVLAAEEVADVVDGDVEVAADELVVVLRLDAGVAEVDRLVADDVREQLRGLGWVHADLLEVAFGRHRLGEDRPVRAEDEAARARVVAEEHADVVRIVLEVVGPHDLQVASPARRARGTARASRCRRAGS